LRSAIGADANAYSNSYSCSHIYAYSNAYSDSHTYGYTKS
jgi:hypothetical protein